MARNPIDETSGCLRQQRRLLHDRRLGIPLPATTQWEIMEDVATVIQPALDELIRQAAQGGLFHNDDTSMRILKLKQPDGDQRTGVFTSGIISVQRLEGGGELCIALFFSGAKHAGESLARVLQQAPSSGDRNRPLLQAMLRQTANPRSEVCDERRKPGTDE